MDLLDDFKSRMLESIDPLFRAAGETIRLYKFGIICKINVNEVILRLFHSLTFLFNFLQQKFIMRKIYHKVRTSKIIIKEADMFVALPFVEIGKEGDNVGQ